MSKKTEKAQVDLIINGETANKSLRDLEAAARKAKSELRGLAPDSKEFSEMRGKLEGVNKALDETKVKAGLAKSSWDKMKDSITTTFIGNLGANLATLGLEKLVSYFTDAWQGALKLSDQFADIQKTTGMTTEEVRELNSELSQIDTRTSMSDLREIVRVGGQFGVAKDQLVDFAKAVDRTAIALGDEFSGGAEEVATVMSKLRNILTDIKSENIGMDIGLISNAINELAAAGVATGPVVADFANRIGGVGSQLGLSSGEILGLSATLQELGVTTERGGTAVVRILQKMLNNTKEFASIAGMDVAKFKDMLNTDLFGAFTKVMDGSKKLGNNSTALASIINELGVDGAGASEVFAKLGSNTELLAEKVKLAENSLTNLDSISNEVKLKNDNLAGSVERLSKEWNKLIASPAVVGFFQFMVEMTERMISGFATWTATIKFNIDILKYGYAEAARMDQEAYDKTRDAKRKEEFKEDLAGKVVDYKQHLQKMSKEEVAAEVNKKARQLKIDVDRTRMLIAQGDKESAALSMMAAERTQAELRAAKQMLKQKSEQGEVNTRLTADEQKKINKEHEKAAKEKAKEAERARKHEWQETKKHYDHLIAEAKKHAKHEVAEFIKKEREKMEELDKFYDLEFLALLDYGVAKAVTDQQQYDAEKMRIEQGYQEKMSKVKAGSYQYLLLQQQMNNALVDLDKSTNQKRLALINEHANSMMGVASALNGFIMGQYTADLNRYRKYNNSKKEVLKNQLDRGVIDAENYQAQMAALDAEAEEKERQTRIKSAEAQRKYALFESAIKIALAWIEAYINPVKIPAAIAATAQGLLIAGTPVPEFYDGGFMPKSSNDKDGFLIKAHANEYMVNAQSMRDPYVMNTVQMIETAKAKGTSPSEVAGAKGNNDNGNAQLVAAANKLIEAATRLEEQIAEGILASVVFDDKTIIELEKKNKKLIDRGEPGLGNSVGDDIVKGTKYTPMGLSIFTWVRRKSDERRV